MKSVALKDVCRITNGGTPKSGAAGFWHGDVAWLTPAEMGKRKTPEIGETARTISQAGLANSSAKLIPANSVVLSTRAPIGHLAINQVPMAFNQGCRGLTPGDGLDTKFLYYFLLFSREALDGLGTGTTFKELSSSSLANFQIPLPPLDEQRRIVVVLDKALAAIATATANVQANLANARALFESYMRSILTERGKGWKEYQFDEVCEISSKLVDPRVPPYFDLPHIGAGNMQPKTGGIIDVLTAREEGLKSGKFLFDESMVLYSKIRPYLMKACRPDFDGLCSADVYPLVPKSGLLERGMLFYILISEEFTAYAESGSARAGMPKVNRNHLFRYSVWLPDVGQQRAIGVWLDKLAAKCQQMATIYQQQLAALAEFRQSLLERAFAGELEGAVAATTVPAANDNFTTPQFTAQVLAFAHRRHEQKQQHRTFGHVKAQKALHLVESVGSVNLGRQPIKDAAGPNDMQHMLRATDWAVQQGFFEFVPRANCKGYDFKKLANYDACWAEAEAATNAVAANLTRSIDLIVDMESDFAELIATTHAAWNNLIIDEAVITDDAIVLAARDSWHDSKLRFDPLRFHDAIRFIRANAIVPDGSATYVGGQERLF